MSDTPYKDARLAGVKCVGFTNPDTGLYDSRTPTQAEVDQEERDLKTPEQIKADAVDTARTDGAVTLLELVAPYTQEERGTWPTQRAEAEAWRLDNNAPCSMLRRMAYHRDISMQVMTDKVMENVELFEYVAGDILGVQQKAIDDIEGA